MPIISNGGNATIAVSANQILMVQVSGGAEFTYENPVGTRLLDSGSNNVFGPFASAGSVKLSSVIGNLFYEVATPPQAIAQFTPGAVAITGGTITGITNETIGSNVSSGDNSALLLLRGLTSSYVSGYHGVRDESTYNGSGTGLIAYASFDAIASVSGPAAYNHFRSFQARPQYAGSGTIGEVSSFTAQTTHSGTGVIALNYGLHVSDALGAGPITNNYGIFIDPLSRGISGNFAIYSQSLTLPSYHAGFWQTGGDILAAGKGTFGGAISGTAIDSSGTPALFGPTGGLGIFGYATNPYARIQAYSNAAGLGKALSLNSGGGNILVNSTVDDGINKVQVYAGSVAVKTIGNGFLVAEGANAKQGTAVLVAGTVTVANTSVTATSRIFLTSQVDGGTVGFLRSSARVAGTSFTITSSSAADTSTAAYQIFEPA